MTPHDDLMIEIEAGERWLSEVCSDPPAPNADRIKRCTRLALDEQWLAERLDDRAPADLAERAKGHVGAALAGQRSPRHPLRQEPRFRPQSISLHRRIGAVAAVAAAIMLALTALYWPESAPLDVTNIDASAQDTDTFEQSCDAPPAESLAILEQELREFEYAYGYTSFAGEEDATFDELLEDIDALMFETLLGGSDWS